MKLTFGKRARLAGFALSTVIGLFFLLDGVMKLVQPPVVLEATMHLGYSVETVAPIGSILLVCTLLYLIPRTSILGAVLLTGYLGGAIASHVRVGEDVFPIVFAFSAGALAWFALYLRDARVRGLFCAKGDGHARA